VINEADYQEFSSKSAYLAAKLLTIFMEYPIIFLGYSVSDNNIQNILKSIVDCLSADQLEKLRERFIFVEYNRGQEQAEITPFTIMIGSKPLTMTKITLSDFLPLYSALGTKKAKLPVRVLRRFKQEVYSYVITSTPTATLRVASIDDNRVSDDNLVLAIGRADQLGLRGLSGITGNDWYRNVILSDLPFSADELLECAFPVLIKQQSNRLPVNKYLSEATKTFPDCDALASRLTLDEIIPNSIRKKQQNGNPYHSVKEVWKSEEKIERRVRLISQLPYEEIDALELEESLLSLFARDRDILENLPATDRSQIRRLILIYDYLKWGNKGKELLD
jgi:hypothetical protein